MKTIDLRIHDTIVLLFENPHTTSDHAEKSARRLREALGDLVKVVPLVGCSLAVLNPVAPNWPDKPSRVAEEETRPPVPGYIKR